MRFVLTCLLVVTVAAAASSQYALHSPYLLDPSRAISYVDSCATFWLKASDTASGGFYTYVNRTGGVMGTTKYMQTQSRDAYGLVRAYMLTGDTLYLQKARSALTFLYNHAWDAANGGWFTSMDRYGNPQNVMANKSAYDQHYGLVGIAAYYEATRDSLAWSWLMRGYANTAAHLWDTRPAFAGYYDNGSASWTARSGKSFNATVDAITTHLLLLYLMTGDEAYRDRTLDVAENILGHLVASMDAQAAGFVEVYDADWNPDNSQTMTIMGHVLKTAWCLARAYRLNPDTTYLAAAKKLVMSVWQKGYDHQLGGPYKDFNRITGQMLMWGIPDTAKAWWQMEQAVTAGLQLFDVTGDSLYLQMADETLGFFMTYFVDHQYGEVFKDRTRYGGQAWGLDKGDDSKGGYHSIELGYYVYLYGNLFVQHRPATLHYQFVPDSVDRTILLTPVAAAPGRLRIRNVDHDNASYAAFDAGNRTLTLPAGTGGEFTVTFEYSTPTAIAEKAPQAPPAAAALMQNYPNPFNPETGIRFQVSGESDVKLVVYDVLGREVAVLVNERKAAGTYTVRFSARGGSASGGDGSGLASGVYIYRLTAGSFSQSRTMLLIK